MLNPPTLALQQLRVFSAWILCDIFNLYFCSVWQLCCNCSTSGERTQNRGEKYCPSLQLQAWSGQSYSTSRLMCCMLYSAALCSYPAQLHDLCPRLEAEITLLRADCAGLDGLLIRFRLRLDIADKAAALLGHAPNSHR